MFFDRESTQNDTVKLHNKTGMWKVQERLPYFLRRGIEYTRIKKWNFSSSVSTRKCCCVSSIQLALQINFNDTDSNFIHEAIIKKRREFWDIAFIFGVRKPTMSRNYSVSRYVNYEYLAGYRHRSAIRIIHVTLLGHIIPPCFE